MRLLEIVETSRRVGETSARLEKIDYLAALLRRLAPEEIEIATGILSGLPRQGRMRLGWSALSSDMPAPAARAALTLEEVDAEFQRIAEASGAGAGAARRHFLSELMARATSAEQDFVARVLLGELRQGALEGVLLEAIAKAAELPADEIKRAAMMAGDLGAVARIALTEGRPGLAFLSIRLFRPVKPMLADSANDARAALLRLGRAAFEYKLDGARIQAHKSSRDVRVFTRRLND
jgi:DNA ligase-1